MSVVICGRVGDEFTNVDLGVLCLVAVDAVFDLLSKVADEALDGPGGRVAEGADRMAFDLIGELFEHVNLSEVRVADLHPLEHVDHPTGAFAAGRALAAALVLVEVREPENGVDHVCLIVHHHNCCCAEAAFVCH